MTGGLRTTLCIIPCREQLRGFLIYVNQELFFNLHYSLEGFIKKYNVTKALKTNALSRLNPGI